MRTQPPPGVAELITQIKAEMVRQDVKLPELAARLGIPYSTLRDRLESVDYRYRDVLEIAQALGVPFPTLVARAEAVAA